MTEADEKTVEEKSSTSDHSETDFQDPTSENPPEPENTENSNSSDQETSSSNNQDSGQLEQALAKAEDKYLRLHAEFENYRRRTAREQVDFMETANGALLEKLSEVLDNFDRAFAEENKSHDLENFEKGMQLIHDQFKKVLRDAGLEEMNPIGEEFDPNTQEAFLKQPSDSVPENHIITVFQKGYKLKSKVLKTAKVIVSAGKN